MSIPFLKSSRKPSSADNTLKSITAALKTLKKDDLIACGIMLGTLGLSVTALKYSKR